MEKEEFIALSQKYNAGLCSPRERALYEKIYKEMVQEGSLAPRWEGGLKEYKRRKILSRIEIKRFECSRRRKRIQVKTWQWAASVLLLVGVGLSTYWLSEPETTEPLYLTKSTAVGQRSKITLRDGSVVTLNANSELMYPEVFSDTLREVTLSGEAFFEIRRGSRRPFIVRSGDVVTTVLGTSFNVRALGAEHVEVTVVEGKVSVGAGVAHSEVVITKGQQAKYSQPLGLLLTQEVNPAHYASWVSRSLHFDMIPFREVVKVLARAYSVEISIRNTRSDECLIRGKYENEKLINVLNGLKWVVNFDYHFAEDGSIIIDGKGCVN